MWEMLSIEGLKWSSLEWQNCPRVPHVCQGRFPCSTGGEGGLFLFLGWKPVQCQISRLPANPCPKFQYPGWVCDFDSHFWGLPSRNHTAPSFLHPCWCCSPFRTPQQIVPHPFTEQNILLLWPEQCGKSIQVGSIGRGQQLHFPSAVYTLL